MKTNSARLIVMIAALVLISTGAWAQSATVAYAQGIVETQKDGTWKAVKLGEQVSASDTIRVRNGGLAEIKAAAGVIHLNKDGTYKLGDLLGQTVAKRDDKVLSLVSGKIGKVSGATSNGVTSTAGGVRGSLAESQNTMWASEDPSETTGIAADPMTDVRKLIDDGKYDAALLKVDGLINGKAADLGFLHLTKARILTLQGLSAAALSEINAAGLKKGQLYYVEAQLLTASVQLDLGAWDDAIKTASANIAAKLETSVGQSFLIMQSVAQKAKGDSASAKVSLQSAVSAGSTTAEGQEASRLLSSL